MAVVKKIIETHISNIRIGDTILCKDSYERTITKENIKKDIFFGIKILGDSYNCGQQYVKKIIFE